MSMISKIVEWDKDKKQREDMCLPELKKELKKRKWTFVLSYCAFIIFAYLGIVLTIGVNEIISLLFITILVGFLAIITAIDFVFTRLLYYLKFNLER